MKFVSKIKRVYVILALAVVIVAEFLLVAPVYAYTVRTTDSTVSLPTSVANCQTIQWMTGTRHYGWLTVTAHIGFGFNSNPFRVRVAAANGPDVLNVTGANLNYTITAGPSDEGYFVFLTNPNTPCDGSLVGPIEGSVSFWHIDVLHKSVLFG